MQKNLSSPTLTARAIGYAGLIPFIGLSAMSVLWRDVHHSAVLFSLLAYGATIISFLGAIHWGLAIQVITLWSCFWVDYKRYPKLGVGQWLSMRLQLTVIAGICLALPVVASKVL